MKVCVGVNEDVQGHRAPVCQSHASTSERDRSSLDRMEVKRADGEVGWEGGVGGAALVMMMIMHCLALGTQRCIYSICDMNVCVVQMMYCIAGGAPSMFIFF